MKWYNRSLSKICTVQNTLNDFLFQNIKLRIYVIVQKIGNNSNLKRERKKIANIIFCMKYNIWYTDIVQPAHIIILSSSSGYTHGKLSNRRQTCVRRTLRWAGRPRRCAAAVADQKRRQAAPERADVAIRTTVAAVRRRRVDDGRARRRRRPSRTTWRKTFWATAACGRPYRIRSW